MIFTENRRTCQWTIVSALGCMIAYWLRIDCEANCSRDKRDNIGVLVQLATSFFSPRTNKFQSSIKIRTKLLTEAKLMSRSMWLDFFVFPAIYFHFYQYIDEESPRFSKFQTCFNFFETWNNDLVLFGIKWAPFSCEYVLLNFLIALQKCTCPKHNNVHFSIFLISFSYFSNFILILSNFIFIFF